jgi:hypothetical protein
LLDGLVLLIDTCHAGVAAEQAGQRWVHVVGQACRRFEGDLRVALPCNQGRVNGYRSCWSITLSREVKHVPVV